jgi:hypothetical protein
LSIYKDSLETKRSIIFIDFVFISDTKSQQITRGRKCNWLHRSHFICTSRSLTMNERDCVSGWFISTSAWTCNLWYSRLLCSIKINLVTNIVCHGYCVCTFYQRANIEKIWIQQFKNVIKALLNFLVRKVISSCPLNVVTWHLVLSWCKQLESLFVYPITD